jgi:adenylate cyclase
VPRPVERLDLAALATSTGELIGRLEPLGALSGPVQSTATELHLDTHSDELAAAGLSLRQCEHAGVRTLELSVLPLEATRVPPRPHATRAFAPGESVGAVARAWVAERFALPLSEAPREVFALTIHRRRWSLAVDAVTVDVVADDIVATEPHGARARLLQVTVAGHDGALVPRRVVSAVRSTSGLSPAEESLAARARAVLGLHVHRHRVKPPRITGEQALVDAARGIVGGWWRVAAGHVPGVRVGLDIEHVHKMRVALRRLRTALQLFGDAFDAGALSEAKQSIKTIARGLGALRDADVQRAAIDDWRERFTEVTPAAWEDVDARLQRRRAVASRAVLALLDGPAWAKAAADVERLLQPDDRGLRHTIEAVSRDVVRRRAKRCNAALDDAMDGDAAAVHSFRIEVKALRYTLDFLADVLPSSLASAAGPLADLQEELGAIQDWVFTGTVADDLRTMPPSPMAEAAHALGLLAGYGRARAQTAALVARAATARLDIESRLAALLSPSSSAAADD